MYCHILHVYCHIFSNEMTESKIFFINLILDTNKLSIFRWPMNSIPIPSFPLAGLKRQV